MDDTNRISSDATTLYRITIEILFENGNIPAVHQEVKITIFQMHSQLHDKTYVRGIIGTGHDLLPDATNP